MNFNIIKQKVDKAKDLFYSNKSKEEIMKEVPISYKSLEKVWEYYYNPKERKERKTRMYAASKTGNKNPRYGKPTLRPVENVDDGNGYTIKWKPTWWTGRKGSKYIFEHQLVMCEYLGLTEMPKDFVVHHINGDRKDNKLENLALLSKSAHSSLHQRENRIRKGIEV
jgi:hypothetical protein